jgi:hypothetical protein
MATLHLVEGGHFQTGGQALFNLKPGIPRTLEALPGPYADRPDGQRGAQL